MDERILHLLRLATGGAGIPGERCEVKMRAGDSMSETERSIVRARGPVEMLSEGKSSTVDEFCPLAINSETVANVGSELDLLSKGKWILVLESAASRMMGYVRLELAHL